MLFVVMYFGCKWGSERNKMANWSDTNIEFTGDPKKLKKAWREISKYLEDMSEYAKGKISKGKIFDNNCYLHLKNGDMDINHIELTEEFLCLRGQSRWCVPHEFFIDLANKLYLDLRIDDYECGCDFYNIYEIVGADNSIKVEGDYMDFGYDYHSIERYELFANNDEILEELDWYFENEEIDENIENILDHFGVERPDSPMYKDVA
jgi:hypothetical protein